jgi:hypothetical protein
MRKAAFLLAAAALLGAAPAAHAQRTVTCESIDGRQELCRVNTSGGVRIVRQFSDSPCVQGRTWWTAREGIWVSRGCRAQFLVGLSGSRGDGRDRDRDGRYGDRDRRWDDRDWSSRARYTCQRTVAARLGTSTRNVATWSESSNRNHARVGFRVGRRQSGTCRVSRDGDVRIDFQRGRR